MSQMRGRKKTVENKYGDPNSLCQASLSLSKQLYWGKTEPCKFYIYCEKPTILSTFTDPVATTMVDLQNFI